MTKANTGWLLLGILWLASFAVAQDTAWEKHFKAGTEAYQQGQYAEAEKQLLAALKEAEAFGELDGRLVYSLNDLAELYRVRSRYTEAEPLYRRALAILEKGLGPDEPDVATALNNLAALCDDQGKYAEAEPLYRRALTIWEKALGPNHPEVAKTLDNYAELLRKTNRKDEAAKLEARAKAIRAKHGQGAESPETGSVRTTAVSSAPSEIDPAKETDIRHLMEVTGAKKQLNQMLPFMAKRMKPLAEQLIMPRLPPDLRDPQIPERFVQRFIERFDPDELINRIVPVYDKYYTHEEIKEIIHFFETPLGRKFLETSVPLMQESMTVGQQYGAELGRKVGAEIADEVLSKRKK